MNKIDNSGMGIAALGRDGDKFMAHVTTGEMVVPPVINEETKQRIIKEMRAAGLNPNEYTVGGGMSINPITGMPEFGFLKKAFKSIKKVVKKAAPVLGVASMFIPGIGPAISGALKAVPGIGGALSGGFNLLTGAGAAGGAGAGAAATGRFSRLKNFFNPAVGTKGVFGGTFGPNLRSGIGKFFSGQMGQQPGMPGGMPSYEQQGMPHGGNFAFMSGGGQNDAYQALSQMNPDQQNAFNSFFTDSQDYPGLMQDPKGNLYDPSTMMNEMMTAFGNSSSGGQMGGLASFFRRDPADKGRTPQFIKSIGDLFGFGGSSGPTNNEGGGSFFGRETPGGIKGIEDFLKRPNMGAAGISALLGKVVYDAAKERQGGLAATPAVTMDSLGRYQLSKALGTGGTRQEFGLGNAPPKLKFATGGVAELDLRDGGESSGPGTGTSDDIPAMLSDGEFVMTAKATRGAGAYNLKNSKSGIEMIKGSSPSREEGVKNMRKLMKIFEAV
jgi:hypothetical protein